MFTARIAEQSIVLSISMESKKDNKYHRPMYRILAMVAWHSGNQFHPITKLLYPGLGQYCDG